MNEQTVVSMLERVERAAADLRGLRSRDALGRIERDYSAIMQAIEWSAAHAGIDDALALANAMIPCWLSLKRLDEGHRVLHALATQEAGPPGQRAMALFGAGYMQFWQGQDAAASVLFDAALGLARSIGDSNVAALSLSGQARVALRSDAERARALCEEALASAGGLQAGTGRSSAMHVLAVAANMLGDLHRAKELMSQRIELARAAGDLAIVASECGNLSMVERKLGDVDRAEALVREAMEIACLRGDAMMAAWMINGLAAVAADRGRSVRAAELLGCGDAALAACGGAWPPDEAELYAQTRSRALDVLGEAGFQRAWARGRDLDSTSAVAFARGAG